MSDETKQQRDIRLANQQHRVIYARVSSLDWQENTPPRDQVEGRLTGGNINIDGTSAVRRTCSVTLVTWPEVELQPKNWVNNTKIKLEIGIKDNDLDDSSEPVWYNQGIYIITSFSQSISTTGNTITIQGKDKMCLLNGEVSGSLESQVDFGKIETVNSDYTTTITKYPIKDIIKQSVHQYAREPFENIIIEDLDGVLGLELREYRGKDPVYFTKTATTDSPPVYQYIIDPTNMTVVVNGQTTKLWELEKYDTFLSGLNISSEKSPTYFKINGEPGGQTYTCVKIDYGKTIGYTETDLTYPGDLIGNVGESFTSILDKIVKMLGYFEYFYDLEGHFVFRQRKDYLETFPLSVVHVSGQKSLVVSGEPIDIFKRNNLINSINNNVNLSNVKNDYSIWGIRRSAGSEIPIHVRYAIDERPNSGGYGDWREAIYQMAVRYYATENKDNAEKTGYEQYYTDLYSFWRQLYDPEIVNKKDKYDGIKSSLETAKNDLEDAKKALKNATSDSEIKEWETKIAALENEIIELTQEWENRPFNLDDFYTEGNYLYWNKNIYENCAALNFWFDFLDVKVSGESESPISVRKIGTRKKVVNDSSVKAVAYDHTPQIILLFNGENAGTREGYTYITINNPSLKEACVISAQGKSAQEEFSNLLYKHACCGETVNITAVPVYFLEPNTILSLNDEKNGIVGNYSINRITLPLTYNGTMSISATRIIDQIIT